MYLKLYKLFLRGLIRNSCIFLRNQVFICLWFIIKFVSDMKLLDLKACACFILRFSKLFHGLMLRLNMKEVKVYHYNLNVLTP